MVTHAEKGSVLPLNAALWAKWTLATSAKHSASQ
jgi:hypothetical protein